MVSKSRFSLIFLHTGSSHTGSSELVNRAETSKLKDAPRVLPARQSGERLFLVFMSSELNERLPGADARELRAH